MKLSNNHWRCHFENFSRYHPFGHLRGLDGSYYDSTSQERRFYGQLWRRRNTGRYEWRFLAEDEFSHEDDGFVNGGLLSAEPITIVGLRALILSYCSRVFFS